MTGLVKFQFQSMLIWTVSFALLGCMSPSEQQQVKDDIFGLQSRILQLETALNNQGKEMSTATNRQEASVSTRLDKVAIEIQRIKGDVDSLRIGVATGQLPGVDPEQEGSVAKTLLQLTERLTQVEENQEKILGAIDKAGDSKKSDKKESANREKERVKEKAAEKKALALKNIDEVRVAFDKKNIRLSQKMAARF